MVSLYIACLSSFISAALTLNVAPQGSIATFADASTSSSNLIELLSPSNQSTSWSNISFTPANPPSLAANISALEALGLDADEPVSWETTPSGNVIGVQCNIRYGRRLDFQDCRDAYNYIPRSDERVARFAQRGSGLPHDVALPQRILGSTSSLPSRFSYWLISTTGKHYRNADGRDRQRQMQHQSLPRSPLRNGEGKREEYR